MAQVIMVVCQGVLAPGWHQTRSEVGFRLHRKHLFLCAPEMIVISLSASATHPDAPDPPRARAATGRDIVGGLSHLVRRRPLIC